MAQKLFLTLHLLDWHLALAQQSFAMPQGGDVLLHTGIQRLLSLPAEHKMHTGQTNQEKPLFVIEKLTEKSSKVMKELYFVFFNHSNPFKIHT